MSVAVRFAGPWIVNPTRLVCALEIGSRNRQRKLAITLRWSCSMPLLIGNKMRRVAEVLIWAVVLHPSSSPIRLAELSEDSLAQGDAVGEMERAKGFEPSTFTLAT